MHIAAAILFQHKDARKQWIAHSIQRCDLLRKARRPDRLAGIDVEFNCLNFHSFPPGFSPFFP